MTGFVSRSQLRLPDNLPIPVDDGQAMHLVGASLPAIAVYSTNNEWVRLDQIKGRSVLFVYVRAKLPGQTALYDYWDTIPGATGCTIEACGFRDNYPDFLQANARIFGMSTECGAVQKQAAQKLSLPFPLLTDMNFEFAILMRLPVFELNEHTFLKRLTMIINDGVVEHVFYPVFPADTHSDEVLQWLKAKKRT